ncbi:hypothetical protein [Sporosarcina sp. FSL K6-1508]|uniref:hypothetical protein n=1 Tax=Sporosarcina sp. FSL K6-1508 TaxID=2921553 RepID=UPI0030F72CDD
MRQIISLAEMKSATWRVSFLNLFIYVELLNPVLNWAKAPIRCQLLTPGSRTHKTGGEAAWLMGSR